jgi:hypothetical protein
LLIVCPLASIYLFFLPALGFSGLLRLSFTLCAFGELLLAAASTRDFVNSRSHPRGFEVIVPPERQGNAPDGDTHRP